MVLANTLRNYLPACLPIYLSPNSSMPSVTRSSSEIPSILPAQIMYHPITENHLPCLFNNPTPLTNQPTAPANHPN